MGGEGGKLDVWGGMWHVLPCGRNLGGICAGLFDKVRVFVRKGMGGGEWDGAGGRERAGRSLARAGRCGDVTCCLLGCQSDGSLREREREREGKRKRETLLNVAALSPMMSSSLKILLL